MVVDIHVDNFCLLLQHFPLINLLLLTLNGSLIQIELKFSVDLLVLGQHLNLAKHLQADLLGTELTLSRLSYVFNTRGEEPLHKLCSLHTFFLVAGMVIREMLIA